MIYCSPDRTILQTYNCYQSFLSEQGCVGGGSGGMCSFPGRRVTADGAGCFHGPARWLQVEVHCHGLQEWWPEGQPTSACLISQLQQVSMASPRCPSPGHPRGPPTERDCLADSYGCRWHVIHTETAEGWSVSHLLPRSYSAAFWWHQAGKCPHS